MNTRNHPIELLSPAGNMESLIAAVSGGCNAVYLGGTTFSARAFAGNFNHEEMIQAVEYCHIRDVKVYVTMNTLLFEEEIDQAMKEVAFLYEHDVDALLIQDLGLFDRVHQVYPDFELHCSTQMHIHNVNGVRFMKEQGATRAVLARETPIEIVEECCKEGIEIEIFAYGALCISYSGQCLMSASVKNRSGNRGMCAQLCRLKYDLCKDNQIVKNPKGEYVLSPKDLNILNRLGELLDAGVTSLKIEGRMKRPEYVWLITRTFREAIDAYLAHESYTVSQARLKELYLMFNRGFTEGNLFHADLESRMSQFRPNHQGIEIGKVLRFQQGKVLVKLSDTLYQHDGLRIFNQPVDTGLTAVRIEKNGLLVNHADAGDEVWLDCASKPAPKAGQVLLKTSDAHLLEEIDQRILKEPRTIPLTLSYTAVAGEPLQVNVSDASGHTVTITSEQLVETAQKAPLSQEKLDQQLSKAGEFPYTITIENRTIEQAFMPVSFINETRRRVLEEITHVRAVRHVRSTAQTYTRTLQAPTLSLPRMLVQTSEEQVQDNEETNTFPRTSAVQEMDDSHMPLIHSLISQVGDLNHPLQDCIAGMTFNCANSYTLAFLLSQKGMDGVVLSSELNDTQVQNLLKAFESRYGFQPCTYRLVYGRRTLMIIKGGVVEENDQIRALIDLQGRKFPVKMKEGNLFVYEDIPYTQPNSGCYGSYLILTDEPNKQREERLKEAYEEIYN